MPANQCASNPVTDVVLARIKQDATEQGYIIAERLGGINDLDEVSDVECS